MKVMRLACLLASLLLTPFLYAQAFRGAWSGSNSYVVGDTVTYLGKTYIDIQATAPVTVSGPTNLFNASAISVGYAINSDTGVQAHYGGDFEASDYIPVPSGGAFVTNITVNTFSGGTNYNIAFYDSNKNFTGGNTTPNNGFYSYPAGTPISVPSGSSYVRFWWETASEGATDSTAIVDAGRTLQNTYTAFGAGGTPTTTPSSAPTDTTHWTVVTGGASAPLPFAGKKLFCLADSIIWANPSACTSIATKVGATLSSMGNTIPGVDAVPGRTFDQFQNGQSQVFNASVVQDVDVLLILLGTNEDSPGGIGSPSDTSSLYNSSLSASMKAMIETILVWKPTMRIVFVGPYQSNRYNVPAGADGIQGNQDSGMTPANASSLAILSKIDAAMKAVCQLYGIPYIDMHDISGVNFSNSSVYLTDGLHPTALGYSTFYIPTIANSLLQYSYQ